MSETDDFKYSFRRIKVKKKTDEPSSSTKESTTPVVKEPEPPVVKEPEPPVVKEPEPPVVKESEAPVVKEPEPPVVKEPEPPVVKEPEPPVVKEPESPVVKEPELAESQKPVDKPEKAKANKAPQADAESFDYVVPKHPYSAKRKRKKRRKHSSDKNRSSSKEKDVDIAADYVFSSPRKRSHYKHHRKKKRMAKWKKVLIIVLSVILALIIAVGATFLIMREIGRVNMHDLDESEIVTPTEDDIVALDPKGQIINYKGKSYELNKDIVSITVIGADDSDILGYDAKMGDAIYILAMDTKTGKIKILGISRDTMTDIDVYSTEGHYIDTENKQISYAYSYSSDKVTGGNNTTISLSRLFFGLSLKNYFAIDMDALKTINDAIGGVTLTSSITFVSPEDGRTISEGETVTLHGEEAEYYIRTRDKSELESNNARMERQFQYIRAFISSIVPAVKEDISRINSLYSMISDNSDSNMSLSDIVYLASVVLPKMKNIDDIEYVSLKGKFTEGEYAEMHVSNDDAITAMLDVFYRPIS